MLIFNLLFVFGIENSNKNLKISDGDIIVNPDNNEIPVRDTVDTPNPSCTAVAALLHYFLLVTFTWNGLSATQLYFLLIRTMKPLPPHFILVISLVGWGKGLHQHCPDISLVAIVSCKQTPIGGLIIIQGTGKENRVMKYCFFLVAFSAVRDQDRCTGHSIS